MVTMKGIVKGAKRALKRLLRPLKISFERVTVYNEKGSKIGRKDVLRLKKNMIVRSRYCGRPYLRIDRPVCTYEPDILVPVVTEEGNLFGYKSSQLL